MKLCLVDTSGDLQYELIQGKNYVGRDKTCEIFIDDKLLSRKHAVLGVAMDNVAIQDLESTNGTMVNFKRVSGAHHLHVGDAITFGEHTFRLAQVGVPLQQTMLGRTSGDGQSFSVSDPGGDLTALHESFPLPRGLENQSFKDMPANIDVKAIVRKSAADLRDASGVLIGGLEGQEPKVLKLNNALSAWDLGRAEDCSLFIPHDTVSQHHARIWREEATWVIEDRASKNGTKVNGRKIRKIALKSGDQIELGYLHFVFLDLIKQATPANSTL